MGIQRLAKSLRNWLRFVLDECLPAVLRDQRWFYGPLLRICFPKVDIDFKRKAPLMTNQQFRDAYERLYPMDSSDMTPRTTAFVMEHLRGKSLLEVGCGDGAIALRCAQSGYEVMATDLTQGNLDAVRAKAGRQGTLSTRQADVEQLPFDDHSFDTTICLHVLEHVRNLPRAVAELKRVTRKRLIVIVPRERYHRYTANYHLQFFGGPEQLQLAMSIPGANCTVLDQCLCYLGDLEVTPDS
jgi:ubiquinone/menaquinone biosynthesis C-methylase UbiE